jgi:hypothetical protein
MKIDKRALLVDNSVSLPHLLNEKAQQIGAVPAP